MDGNKYIDDKSQGYACWSTSIGSSILLIICIFAFPLTKAEMFDVFQFFYVGTIVVFCLMYWGFRLWFYLEKKANKHMYKCQRCNSKRLLNFSAHCRDCFSCDLDGIEYNGYVPDFDFGGGDDVCMTVCLDCGQVQGEFPHQKIEKLEPDLSDLSVETMLEYSEMNSKCDLCKELIGELKYDSSPGECLENYKRWFYVHQIEHHNESGLF